MWCRRGAAYRRSQRGTFSALLSSFDMTMTDEAKTDLLRGTLQLLILKALALEPLHGVAISRRIEQITGGTFGVSFGSLFPALHKMEERGWVTAEWRVSVNNRRARFYRLTDRGRAQVEVEEREWHRVAQAMKAAIESA